MLYIEPGSPWENAYAETFISCLEDELLGREVFATLLEAKALLEEYRRHYNHERPHGALGYRTPGEFGALCELERVDDELMKELESVSTLS
jgi:putative transposase